VQQRRRSGTRWAACRPRRPLRRRCRCPCSPGRACRPPEYERVCVNQSNSRRIDKVTVRKSSALRQKIISH
jgi:hypothetical protein